MKRSMLKVFMVLALATVICLPGVAGAVSVIGGPEPDHSWSQRWQEDSVGNFNALEFFMISPASIDLETPGFRNFSTAGWTVADPNPKYAFGTNSGEITLTQWDSFFTGIATVGTTLDFFAWDGGILGTVKDSARAIYNPNTPGNSYGWNFSTVSDPTGHNYDRSAVPIPPAVLLFGSGLLGLGLLGRRKFKKV